MFSPDLRPIHAWLQSVYAECEYPALSEQASSWAVVRPLEGLAVLDATPVYRNTLQKHLALIAAGAHLSVGISSVMAHDPQVVDRLRACGIPVYSADTVSSMPKFDLILDCAGSFSSISPRIGYVELTRSGADAYRKQGKPVFFADGGKIKRIETCLGTGESYFRAMRQLGYAEWAGKRLLVFGSGKVGTGILYYARKAGARATVITDPSTLHPSLLSYVENVVDYRDIPSVCAALEHAYAVVTATGVRHALAQIPREALLQSGALLTNMGVEDEYGPHIPENAVLNRKRTINFLLEEPTHLKYIDATMALHNAGAVYLAEHEADFTGYAFLNPPVEMESEILAVTRSKGIISEELSIID